ncbi:glutamate receptor ionotropic, delta-2 [Contarinia nasturtii]|uniref:glutamate receptor ionotropic, delta-2 n=1 Tax=Contarinia nasturtii TaxID=265458 RepID=UPI0012D4ADF8|nr:glutamate receptor ionotropic, delta-2 [Contarinia nasturtii]
MPGLKIIFIMLYVITYGSCEFSELVNIDAIIDSAKQLPEFNVQVLTDQEESIKLKEQWNELKANLSGSVLKVVTLEDPPLSYTEVDSSGKLVGKGVAFKLFQFLMDKFNFTYEIVKHDRNIIGSIEDLNGSLLHTLSKNDAEVAVAFLPVLSDTRDFAKYSKTILDEGEWIMLMRRPVMSATGTGLLAPFTLQVWILILVSLLVVGPLIYCIIILRYKLTGDTEQQKYALPHCMWFVYGALLKQGSTLSPIADSTRLIFATWWIFITILTSFYTANLTAFLTLSKFTLPINSWDDIYKTQKEFVSIKGGCVEYAILNSNESLTVMRTMYDDHRIIFSDKSDNDTLNEYVFRDNYVLVRDRPAINHLIYNDYQDRKAKNPADEKKQCPFATAKEPFMKRKRSFAYQLNTDLNIIFDAELLTLVETGIVKFMLGENLTNAEICPQNLGGTERQLRNSDLSMTYYIMLAGFCTAVMIFLTEIMFKLINRRLNYDNLRFQQSPLDKNVSNDRIKKKILNVTPPPSYQTLFDRNKIFTTDEHVKTLNVNSGVKRSINGRDYMVFLSNDGEPRLVPLRTPSAALFQYAYTK